MASQIPAQERSREVAALPVARTLGFSAFYRLKAGAEFPQQWGGKNETTSRFGLIK